jgi:hypothetical protein
VGLGATALKGIVDVKDAPVAHAGADLHLLERVTPVEARLFGAKQKPKSNQNQNKDQMVPAELHLYLRPKLVSLKVWGPEGWAAIWVHAPWAWGDHQPIDAVTIPRGATAPEQDEDDEDHDHKEVVPAELHLLIA